ncbi:hypothetical protein niasHS_008431 [Heterodera schachtii]|uniref:GBF1-like tetratricopeptide repeats domain-containing protein n=1 Tax=Heterodera schachtii TaxID=97005 RepID=A0ABD2IUV1_HETSC
MTNIVLENRDRLAQVWSPVRDHLRTLLSHFPHNQQLMERAVVSIVRIANRNLFRLGQHFTPTPIEKGKQTSEAVMTPNLATQKQSQQIIAGQNKCVVIVVDPMDDDKQHKQQRGEVTNKDSLASNQQTVQDRASNCADEVLHFMGCELLALRPPELFLFSRQIAFGLHQLLRANAANLHASEHWEMFFILLESAGAAAYRDEIDGAEMVELPPPPLPKDCSSVFKRGTIVLAFNLSRHDPAAFLKVCEILTFLARDAAHITPSNFAQFTRCLRTMVEASLDGGKCAPMKLPATPPSAQTLSNDNHSKQFSVPNNDQNGTNNVTEQQHIGEGERAVGEHERLSNCYMDASLQLLTICAQLHARAATIHKEWSTAAESNSFRVPALSELMQPADWEDCFAEVLFPLLSKLLASSPPISPMDPIGMEEARIRAIQFICKILLGNLTQISRLDSFADLLSHLFELMDQFLEGSSCSDLLAEVIQESLKNCVLVCENFGVFRDNLAELHGQLQERLNALAKKHEIASSVGTIKLST